MKTWRNDHCGCQSTPHTSGSGERPGNEVGSKKGNIGDCPGGYIPNNTSRHRVCIESEAARSQWEVVDLWLQGSPQNGVETTYHQNPADEFLHKPIKHSTMRVSKIHREIPLTGQGSSGALGMRGHLW